MPPFSTPLLDDFTRADENPVSQGGNWSGPLRTGDVSTMAVISNGLQKFDTVNFNEASRVYEMTAQDVEVWATCLAAPNGAVRFAARVNNPNNAGITGYWLELGGTSFNTWALHKLPSGQLGIAAGPQPVAAGDSIGLQVIGTDINAWYLPAGGEWRLVISRSDSTSQAPGRIGFSTNSPGTRWAAFGGGAIDRAPIAAYRELESKGMGPLR